MRFAVVEAGVGPGLAWAASLALALAFGTGCSDGDHRDKYFGTDMATEIKPGPGPEASVGTEVGAEVRDAGTDTDAGKDATDADAGDAADTMEADTAQADPPIDGAADTALDATEAPAADAADGPSP